MSKRHKHAGLIHAWADGANIQERGDANMEWLRAINPGWYEDWEYRIEPRTVKREGWAVIDKYCVGETHMVERIYGSEDAAKKDYPYALNIIKIEWPENV